MTYFKETAIKDPQTGRQAWVSEFNSLRTAPITRLVGTPFLGSTKDTNFWAEIVAGSGTVAQAAGVVVLATGITANSTVQYQTVRLARWVTGDENTFRTVLKLGDTGTLLNTRNWGAFDANNGFFFQLSGTTLNIVSRAGGADTAVAKAAWNVNNTFTLDTNYHIYEIKMTYADVHFYIDHVMVHTIANIGTATISSQSLNLPVTLQNINAGGGAANVSMTVGVAFISRTGLLSTDNKFINLTGGNTVTTLKYGAGRLHRVIVNGAGGTSVIIFDNITNAGTIIATLSLANPPISIEFNCPFFTGLCTQTTGGGSPNLTCIYE